MPLSTKKKVTKTKAAPKKKSAKSKAPPALAEVTHYYDRLGVAILKLKAPMHVGDLVTFHRGEQEFSQPISSLQIEHAQVDTAKKGDLVGVKVNEPVKEGAVVMAG